MTRFRFEGLEYEPSGLKDYYEAMGNVRRTSDVTTYIVPAGLQTLDYAESTFRKWNGEELASLRATTRIEREATLDEAGVARTVCMGATALQHLHMADKAVMLDQATHIRRLVEEDIEAGPNSTLRIGIIPAEHIARLADSIPPAMSLYVPNDMKTIETGSELYIATNDCFDLTGGGDPGIRGREAKRRLALSQVAASNAVFGEQALAQIDLSEAISRSL